MEIYIKIGTHPATYMQVVHMRKPPAIGDSICVKEDDKPGTKPHSVLIDDIKTVHGQVLYFAARF